MSSPWFPSSGGMGPASGWSIFQFSGEIAKYNPPGFLDHLLANAWASRCGLEAGCLIFPPARSNRVALPLQAPSRRSWETSSSCRRYGSTTTSSQVNFVLLFGGFNLFSTLFIWSRTATHPRVGEYDISQLAEYPLLYLIPPATSFVQDPFPRSWER